MNRAQYQGEKGLSARSTDIRTLWIRRSWVGIMMAGFGIAPAIAQTIETPEITPAPTFPNRSVQRLSRPTLRLESQGEPVSELQAMLTLLGYYTGPVDGVYQEATQVAVAKFQQAAGLVADGVVGPATWTLLLPTPPDQASPPIAPTETVASTAAVEATVSTAEPEAIPEAADENPNADQPAAAQAANTTNSNEAEQTSPVTLPILRQGMHGAAIARLQERLQILGVYSGLIDGVFGPETERAVRQAQRDNNIQPDGVVGPETWKTVLREGNGD